MVKCKRKTTSKTIYFIRKMKIGDEPDYLTEQLRYVGEIQPYSLRNVMDFRFQQANTTAKQKSLFYKRINLYNMLPFDVKNEINDKVFKKSVIFIRSIN